MPRVIASLMIVVCSVSWALAEEEKVPLKTEIPEEVLVGTPPDVLSMLFPGLEKLPKGERPEFLVPKGTVNLALKKKVTSSDANPVLGELKYVTDGNKEGTEDSYVELGPMLQWVQIDLEKPSAIYAIFVWRYFREARSYTDVVVQVSDDEKFAKNVKTIYSNDQDNSARLGIGKARPYIETNLGRLIDAKGAKGRFVRLYSQGNTANDLNHYIEVEIFGKPAS
ncbi:MAG: discoidin domain-containing protein [Planctomycetes bacterium]|nr:discoidin domain-containing protein [Planctomycetota bacterium]MBL7041572.1 discoidin domain-containing protein [Pirellulaceae bacterium]